MGQLFLKRAANREGKLGFIERNAVILHETRHTELRRIVAFNIKHDAVQFIDIWWEKNTQDLHEVVNFQQIMDTSTDQKIQLILELRKKIKNTQILKDLLILN